MSMLRESLAYPEGVIDVGIIVVTLFDNPLRTEALKFIAEILKQKRKIAIPIPTLLGAYHIATRYLRIKRIEVKRILTDMLSTKSPAFYPQITIELALDSLEYSTYYNVESWDGFIIALAKKIGNSIIYTLDEELRKIKDIIAVNPFPEQLIKQYHKYLEESRKNNDSVKFPKSMNPKNDN